MYLVNTKSRIYNIRFEALLNADNQMVRMSTKLAMTGPYFRAIGGEWF